MSLANGHYRTEAGSEMRISGQYGGISEVLFDWAEEPDACPECEVDVYESDGDLVWHCDCCGGGRAKLHSVEN